jgi:hypothetical protein
MPKKKTGRKKATPRRQRKPTTPHVYRMPHTAAELKIDCAVCHAPAVWFDYGRAKRDHRAGFVCDAEPQMGQRGKLLVKESEGERAA